MDLALGLLAKEKAAHEETRAALEARVRHLELYGTANVDSWLTQIVDRLDKMEATLKLSAASASARPEQEQDSLRGTMATEIAWPQDAESLIEMAREWPVPESDAGDMFTGDVLIRKLGNALAAALAGREGVEPPWQDIETAPTATDLVVAVPRGDAMVVGEARHHDDGHWYWANESPGEWGACCIHPTHWMPMPKPPVASAGRSSIPGEAGTK